jgi:hypothetical protein
VTDTTVIDNDVRLHIYRSFLANGAPPAVAETARALSMTEGDATLAYSGSPTRASSCSGQAHTTSSWPRHSRRHRRVVP